MNEQDLTDFGTALASLATAPFVVGAVIALVVLLWFMIRHNL